MEILLTLISFDLRCRQFVVLRGPHVMHLNIFQYLLSGTYLRYYAKRAIFRTARYFIEEKSRASAISCVSRIEMDGLARG